MKSIFKTFLLSLMMVANVHLAYAQTASLLPNAVQQFLDSNGNPLTSGTVTTYVPNTTTLKTTWQDANQTTPWANPLTLNAAGRPPGNVGIFGNGSYRQQVKDRYGNIIWDQVTSSTGSGSSSSTATGDGDLVGTIKPWAGMTAPNQYAFTYGQEVSRTTYSVLFTAITSTQAAFCTSGSPTLTGVGDTNNFWIGMSVEVSCVPAGFSTIISKTTNSVTLAANANVTTNTNAIFFPWGRGNGSTTFNLPDLRGVVPMGNNIMGGVASSNISTTYFGIATPNAVGSPGGGESVTLAAGNLPTHTHTSSTLTDPGHQHNVLNIGTAFGAGAGGTNVVQFINNQVTQSSSTGITISANTGTNASGLSTPFSRVMPTKTTNYIIKITPDTNSATASGVTSLGSMTGDIACGAGLTCTGNTISATIAGVTSLGGMTGVLSCGSGINCSSSTVSSNLPITTVADRTALKALDTTIYSTVALRESGREGIFNFVSGNYTTPIATDTNEGVYIKANAIAAASGAWVRQFDFTNYQMKWFGAVADYSTDNTTRVNSAIAVGNVQNTNSSVAKQTAVFINIEGGVKFASQNVQWLPSTNWVFVYLRFFANSDTTIGVSTGGGGTNELHLLNVTSGYPGDATGALVSEDMWAAPIHPSRGVNIQKNIDNTIYGHSGTTQSVQPYDNGPATGTEAYIRDENLDRFRLTYTNYGANSRFNGTAAYTTNRVTSLTATNVGVGAGWGGAAVPVAGDVVRGVTTLSRYVVTSLAANILTTEWLSGTAIPGEFLLRERAIFKASFSGTTMTVASFYQGSGNLAVGQTCVGLFPNSGITAGTTISVSAGGGTGAYTMNNSMTVAQTLVTCGPLSVNSIQGGGVTNTDTTYAPVIFYKKGEVVVNNRTFAQLNTCSSLTIGAMASVSDSNVNTWGTAIAGGGANQVLAYCNGTSWTVMAK